MNKWKRFKSCPDSIDDHGSYQFIEDGAVLISGDEIVAVGDYTIVSD